MTFTAHFSHDDAKYHLSASSDGEAGRRCDLGFNPGNHAPTHKIKLACAAAMQSVINERDATIAKYAKRDQELGEKGEKMPTREYEAHGDALRCFATALTHLETAQMFAVKGLHTRANAGVRD